MATKLQQHMQNLCYIFQQSVDAVRPAKLLTAANNCALQPKSSADGQSLVMELQGNMLDITNKNCYVVGFGKAVLGMAVQLERALGSRLKHGILSTPLGTQQRFHQQPEMQLSSRTCIRICEGAPNNLPDERAMSTAKAIKDLAMQLNSQDILFVLISGGGSALLPLPRAPLTLNEKLQLVQQLASKGASIEELNVVRIACSDIKGGRLVAAAANAAAVISLIISDIVNDPLHMIASGPTVCSSDSSSHCSDSAQKVLQKYEMWTILPAHIQQLISSSTLTQPKLNNKNICLLVGNNRVATAAAATQALQCGYQPFIASTTINGELQELVSRYDALLHNIYRFRRQQINAIELRALYPFDMYHFENFLETLQLCADNAAPLLLILAGEPTVKLSGAGIGGCNQELALRMSLRCHERKELKDICFLSAGTDGIDGPTPAAGALGGSYIIEQYLRNDGECVERLQSWLEANDSYSFYSALNAGEFHVITGHTGTNVMDLHLILVP